MTAAGCALLGAGLVWTTTPAVASCPNEQFRSGELSPSSHPSAALPDCRAYEQASPVGKGGGDAEGEFNATRASLSGDGITFASLVGVPAPGGGAQEIRLYLAKREGSAWSTQNLFPPAALGSQGFVRGWTPDLGSVFSEAGFVSGHRFLARSTANEDFAEGAPPTAGAGYGYAGASADGVTVLFESNVALPVSGGPAAVAGRPNLYAWDRQTGEVRLAGVLPGGGAARRGSFAGPYKWFEGVSPASLKEGGASPVDSETGDGPSYYTQNTHAVTTDGSTFFTAAGSGQLYLRTDPAGSSAATLHVSASQRTIGNGPGGTDANGPRPAAFLAASADGSRAFFTSSEKLTDDATTGGVEPPAFKPPAIARADITAGACAPATPPCHVDLSFIPATASDLAIQGEYVYWADPTDGVIGRAKLDGSVVEPELIQGQVEVEPGVSVNAVQGIGGIATDSEYVYWTNNFGSANGKGAIARARLDGSEVKPKFIPGKVGTVNVISVPGGLAVDSEYVYWSNNGSSAATRGIGRAKKADGSEIIASYLSGHGRGGDIAVGGGYLYFSELPAGTTPGTFIGRAKLGAATAEEVDAGYVTGLGSVWRLTLDGSATRLYWADSGMESVGTAKIGASAEEVEAEFVPAAGKPEGVAVDAEHLYWAANQGESTPNPGNDLYRWRAQGAGGCATAGGCLTDITVDPSAADVCPETATPCGAQVKGVLGASEAGDYVYFAANGDLDGAGPATTGDCNGQQVNRLFQFSGECSLYLWHDDGSAAGEVTFVARLGVTGGARQSDAADWLPTTNTQPTTERAARVSADGRTLLFRSQRQLTGYDNEGEVELYRYQAGDAPACVSCNPTGAPPTGAPSFGQITVPAFSGRSVSPSFSHNLSGDGKRVFFETPDKLVPADTNGDVNCPLFPGTGELTWFHVAVPRCLDVYEWEAAETGSCEEGEAAFNPASGGCLYLISTGTSDEPAFFADASASGDDAFFFTREKLVRQDKDELVDVYDASHLGGLASQNETQPLACEGEGCKPGPSAAPATESAGTASFAGPANPKALRHHRRHRHGRRHHKRKSHNSRHRRAGAERRTSR